MNKIPSLTIDLVKDLDERFPLKLPNNINFTNQEIAYLMGQRSIIDFIKSRLKDEDEDGGLDNVL